MEFTIYAPRFGLRALFFFWECVADELPTRALSEMSSIKGPEPFCFDQEDDGLVAGGIPNFLLNEQSLAIK